VEYCAKMQSGGAGLLRRLFHVHFLIVFSYRLLVVSALMAAAVWLAAMRLPTGV
jgi:hypothetical protein